jgi:hypothetical protein
MIGRDEKFEVPKEKLLEILKTNRTAHVAAYKEASTVWQKEAIEEMEKNLRIAHESGHIIQGTMLDKPKHHTKDYSDVIGLLELSSDTSVSLGFSDYRKYVNDEWDWKRGFETANSQYLGG